MSRTIAFPTQLPGGVEANLSGHFGRCDIFTLVTLEDSGDATVRLIENGPHHEGGCGSLVDVLADAGARILVAQGMGARPLQGFEQAGIMVLQSGGAQTVKEALEGALEGKLQRFSSSAVCSQH